VKKGLFRFFTFLLIGICVGLYLRAEDYAAKEMLNLLADEVRDGTGGCQLEYKKASLSLTTLNAKAQDVSVLCNGKVALRFDQILLNASWRSIFSKVVEFDDLRLIKGKAFGVSPKSATYKFIDYLTSPSPEGSKPPLIKILLHKLSVEESSFEEELGRNLLVADGFRMSLHYDENRDAILKPFISKLDYVIRRPNQQSSLPLGEAKGDIKITDEQTQIENFIVNRDGSQVSANGHETIGQKNTLNGQSNLDITLQYMGLPDWLVGKLSGQSKVSGSLGSPILNGNFVTKPSFPLGLKPGGFTVIEIEGVSGDFSIDVNDGDPIVTVTKLSGEHNGQTINIVKPLQIIDGNLTGQLKISTQKLIVGPVEFRNIDSSVSLSGPLDKVTANLTGNIKEVEFLNAIVRQVAFKAHNQDQFFLVDAFQENIPQGTLNLKAKVDLSGKEPIIDSAEYDFSNYPFLHLYNATTDRTINLARLTGTGQVSGAFDPGRIDLKSKFKATSWLLSDQDIINNELTIKNGKLDYQTTTNNSNNKLASLTLELTDKTDGQLKVNLAKDSGYTILPAACVSSDSILDLKFQRGNFIAASGGLNLKNLDVGCQDSLLKLSKPTTINISNGVFNLGTTEFISLNNKLSLKGNFAPFGASSLHVNGNLPLNSFDQILPSIDDLSGAISVNLSIDGKLKNPTILGKAVLKDGRIGLESSDITLSAINGTANFDGSVVKLSNFAGELNGGNFTITGEYVLADPSASKLSFNAQGMGFAPTNGLTVAANADLKLSQINNRTGIEGLVSVTSAEFEKRLDVTTLAKNVVDFVFASRQPLQVSSGQSSSNLDMPLAIKVSANRNILAITNFFGIESRGNIDITGTISNPSISGSIEALNGWFGLREQKFNLTNGSVNFSGNESIPTFTVFGESLVRSTAGDIVTVYLEAFGSIDSPTIRLSSDTGLSQSEILTLLTSSGQIMQQTLINQVGSNSMSNAFSIIDAVPILNYSQFLRYLGQIDSISIEPQFNIQTGLIEPTVSATKRLSNSVYLLGQGFLGSQITETRIGAVYNILPYLNFQAFFTSASDQQNVALEVNSAITLLAQRKKYANIIIRGNKEITSDEILLSSNLNTTSRITPEEMINIRQAITKLYRRASYFDARVKSICRSDGQFCKTIELDIEEGNASKISSVKLLDDITQQQTPIPDDLIPYDQVSSFADAKILTTARDDITTWLRKNGFLGARVDAKYKENKLSLSNDRELIFTIHRGRPISFQFNGNTYFDSESLLSTINIKSRKVPFGANTGRILAQSIDQLYREAGYLDVNVSQDRVNLDNSDKDLIKVDINEGIQYKPNGVKFVGLVTFSEKQLIKKISNLGPNISRDILHPQTLLKETIELNAKEIRKILIQSGFTEATVEVGFDKDKESKNAEVVYQISEGTRSEQINIQSVKFVNTSQEELPELPDLPKSAIYQSTLKELTENILKSLSDQGYRNPTLELTKEDLDKFVINVDLGPLTQTGTIEFSGLQDIPEQYIRNISELNSGDALSQNKLRALKHKLLSQGMFSKIEIKETDSADPTIKNIKIEVQEKPLTTLDLGGGYNTEFGAHIFAEGVDRSLFKDGRSLSLRLDAYVNSPSGESISRGIAALKYTSPSFLDSKYVLTEDLRFQKFNASVYEFDLDRTSLTSSIYRNWGSGLSASLGHTALSENLSDVSPDVVIGEHDSGTNFLSYLGTTLSFDRRDNPLNPSRGYNLILDAKYASNHIGSDANYVGTGLRVSNLIPFDIGFNRFAFAQSIRSGIMQPFGGDEFVPISQRYYLGGRTTVRGYGENKLGPRGAQEGILGGESMLSGSLELQYRLLDSFSFNTFFDAGNVYLNSFNQESAGISSDIISEDNDLFRYSTGVGVRFLSPIGPIGLDLGFPINGRQEDDPWRVHFNIGSNF
jgi:outer membrane protein insertion porin family